MENFVATLNANIINPLIYLLFALAAVYFVIGLLQFVLNAANEEARAVGKRHMIYALIGLFIMVAVFGIINLVLGTFGISKTVG